MTTTTSAALRANSRSATKRGKNLLKFTCLGQKSGLVQVGKSSFLSSSESICHNMLSPLAFEGPFLGRICVCLSFLLSLFHFICLLLPDCSVSLHCLFVCLDELSVCLPAVGDLWSLGWRDSRISRGLRVAPCPRQPQSDFCNSIARIKSKTRSRPLASSSAVTPF